MKRLFIKGLVLVVGSLILTSQNVFSDNINVPKAEYKGNALKLADFSGGKEDIFLYNPAMDLFANAGGKWGTHLSTFTVGLPINIAKSGSYYLLSGPFEKGIGAAGTGTDNYIGVYVQTDTNNDGIYWDRANDSNNSTLWQFETVDDTTFYIKTSTGYYMKAHEAMKVDANNLNAVGYLTTTQFNALSAADKKYCEWRVVSKEDIEDDFKDTYNKEHPANATYLIRAQNFNRQDQYIYAEDDKNGYVEGWHVGGTIKLNTDIKDKLSSPASQKSCYEYSVSLNNATDGMYYIGKLNGKAAVGDRVYQKVKVPKKGWYRLDCQGFYYNNESEGTCNGELYAIVKGEESTPNTSKNSYVDLRPITHEMWNNYESADTHDKALAAGKAFYNSKYSNSLLVYVPEDDTEIELGIRVKLTLTDNDFLWFDNFELRYLGTETFLDETATDFHNPDNGSYKKRVLVLKKKMTVGKWNSIILPVNLTKQQLFTAFFPNPKISELTGFLDDHTIGFTMKDISSMSDEDIALEAGKCYLINPGFGGKTEKTYEVNLDDGGTYTITQPFYLIDRVTLDKAAIGNTDGLDIDDITTNEEFTGKDESGIFNTGCKLSMHGTYQKRGNIAGMDKRIPANAYVFYDGDMYHLVSPYTLKGFSCWLEDEHQMNNGTRHNISFAFNGVSDGTTAIEGIYVNGDEYNTVNGGSNNNVYNLNGQKVRRGTTSTAGLPKGIYIVNGKKVMVN